MWWLYVLRCADGTLYTGITIDIGRRVAAHNDGKAAKYTRSRGPVVLERSWPYSDHSGAAKAEVAFKRLSRAEKLRYVAHPEDWQRTDS